MEYGTNEIIPQSKGSEHLCPGNNISQGIVRLDQIGQGDDTNPDTAAYKGYNNGNGGESIDAFFNQNRAPFDDEGE